MVIFLNPLGTRAFWKKNLDFDIKISKACGLKGVKDRDLLYIRKMLNMTKSLSRV